MAELVAASSSSPLSPDPMRSKPVVVRVKRKSYQGRLDAFWLEINQRPSKRPTLDLASLSISDSGGKVVQEELKTKKLLVKHVETVNKFEALKDVLQSFLPDCDDSKNSKRKIEERSSLRKDNKHAQLRSVARHRHEDLARGARFEQIWRSRRGSNTEEEDSFRELCHLYDVVQVDMEEEKSGKVRKAEDVSVEDNAILCNYLPLMREFLPQAAEEIESEMYAYISKEDNYVYDFYAAYSSGNEMEEDISVDYPLVEVNADGDDYYDGPLQSEFESDDSNAEDNPLNDYPDEESSEDDGNDPLDDLNGWDPQYEEAIYSDEEDDLK